MNKSIFELSKVEYFVLFCPLLAFPSFFIPYNLFGVRLFAHFVRIFTEGQPGNAFWMAFHSNQTIIFFWLAVSAAVMLASVVIALLKVRPWYYVPVYLIVMVSFCGILSLGFYTAMTR